MHATIYNSCSAFFFLKKKNVYLSDKTKIELILLLFWDSSGDKSWLLLKVYLKDSDYQHFNISVITGFLGS